MLKVLSKLSNRKLESSPTPKNRGVYLSIGLNYIDKNHYGVDGRLKACNKDATDISVLAEKAGFRPYSKGGILLNESANRQNINNAISDIGKYLRSNDVFLLNYSGHGGRLPDLSGDEEDKYDETWCLYDGQLLDDELYGLLSKFAEGVMVIILSDSCHSGTVSKVLMSEMVTIDLENDNIPRFKTLSNETLVKTFEVNKEFYINITNQSKLENTSGDKIEPDASVLLISGCQDNQLSLDGPANSLFTHTLKNVWADGSFDGNYIKFHESIVKRMPPYQTPNLFVFGKNKDIINTKPFSI